MQLHNRELARLPFSDNPACRRAPALLSLALVLLATLVGCGGGGSGGGGAPAPAVVALDVSGSWNILEVCFQADCGDPDETENYDATVTQVGSQLTIVTNDGTFQGTITGQAVTWSGSMNEDNGVVTFTTNGTVTADGTSMTATSTWQWTDGVDSCSGTCDITGSRTSGPPPQVDLTGTWDVTSVCDETACGDGIVQTDFVFQVVQTGDIVTLMTPQGTFDGSVFGLQATWIETFAEDGGMTTASVSIQVAANGDSFTGSSTWSWTDGVDSCSGTCDITGSRQQTPPAQPIDIAGSWFVDEFCNQQNCGEPNESQMYNVDVVQNGTNVTLTSFQGTFFGTLSGNVLSYSGSYPEDGGTATFTATVTFDASVSNYSGSSSWTWTDGAFSCSGTCDLSGSMSTSGTCIAGDLVLGATVFDSTASATNDFTPSCANSNAPDLAYSFQAPTSATYTFTTNGSVLDTILTVLDGVCMGAEIACNDDAQPGVALYSEVQVFLNAGQTVTVVVDAYGTNQGSFQLNVQ